MTDGRSQVNFTVDDSAKSLAKEKLEHGELSQQLRRKVEEIAFGEEISQRSKLEERLDTLQDRRDELKSDREAINAELEEVENKIDRVESRLDELETREDEYHVALEMLEDQLMDGTHVFPGHGQVQKAAHVGECDPQDVIDDLQDRNPSVPSYAFMDKMAAPQEWTGSHEQSRGNGGGMV